MAFAYSVLSCITAYLAHYYRPEFMAQVLNIEDDNKKIDYYIDVCKDNNIHIYAPNINTSDSEFKAENGNISYGISKITKVGKTTDSIIENRPYNSLEDLQVKVKPRKDVFENLIKSGCFDFVNLNRYQLLNSLYDIRKDKVDKVERYDVMTYDVEACRSFEQDSIKTQLTYPSLFKQAKKGVEVSFECKLKNITERIDKNGNTYGIYDLEIDGTNVKAMCFSRTHSGARISLFNKMENNKPVVLKGKIDDKNMFMVNKYCETETILLNTELPLIANL